MCPCLLRSVTELPRPPARFPVCSSYKPRPSSFFARPCCWPHPFASLPPVSLPQVYAASVMFGYFIRRVDTRFQLEKQLGTLPLSQEDAVARLERMFAAVRWAGEFGSWRGS